ncbi:MFS transporter [Anaeromyxobacter sp. Fw109-5]|uniref:MFS transporter n=1 Tax=Anaeromyxobacter sp. (strain Fw109-5) TaxID=404589 RepID=UPI0000ED760A|nr:MFS transporter [Anaeromyxobacter sp. Fw109-5]ABS25924.1 major facilitator superfamily MFS_1 [Anaeromyxobacter sp. Fw109-5]
MSGSRPPRPRRTLLERLGLDRPELRAWVLYDVANSAAVTSVLTAILPIYFARVAGAELPPAVATQRFALATTAGLAVVAVLAPVLGTLADVRPVKKRMLAAFALAGAAATAALAAVGPGDWVLATALLVLLNVGLNGSLVFYDALLPHVAREDELNRVSSAGYAAGYLGGGLLLAAQLAWIARPELLGLPRGGTLPARLAFVSVAIWWLAFTLPLLLGVREPAVRAPAGAGREGTREGTRARLARTFRQLRRHPDAALLLAAFLVYNDGIGTIIRMAAIYGSELGLPRGALIGAILLVQLVGVPCAYLFAAVAGRLGPKRAILVGLAVYTGIAVLGYFTRTAAHFFALAILVGLVQGGTQALSRSLFASMVPRHLSGEFFGFFAISEKFAGIFGPAVFAAAIALTGSSRGAVLSVIGFFVAGAALLLRVDVEQGRRVARAAEARAAADAPEQPG